MPELKTNKRKIIWTIIGTFISIIILMFVLELVGVGFFKFFEPMKEDIRREVFEETKSYVHGKIQDLAKYYQEYQIANNEEKEVISNLIKSQFAEFDEQNIRVEKLRNFLINIRGY